MLTVLVAGYFLYVNRSQKSIEVSKDVLNKLNDNRPTLSQDEEKFLSLLLQNAVSGGPPKDGIPSIDNPKYTTASEADSWLLPNDIVFGVDYNASLQERSDVIASDYNGFVAAYPQRILVWHEIANDQINEEKISVSYCPLTGTAIGFRGSVAQNLDSTFGVSGKLVNSNLIMYDRVSGSYWPQILGKSIKGPAKGKRLEEFPIIWTTWERWKKEHPDTKVLSQDTGFVRNYDANGDPYGSYIRADKGYYTSDRLIFEPINKDNRLKAKTVVVGIRDNQGNAVAILKNTLRQKKVIEASLGGKTVVVEYDENLDFYRAKLKETAEWINSIDSMWFAWAAFYPKTDLIQ